MDGDVDLLREALRVLVDGIMDAEVSAGMALSTAAAQSGSRNLRAESRRRQLLPQPAGTTAAQREGCCR